MSIGAVPYPIVPPLPEHEHRTSTTSTEGPDRTTEQKQLSDEQKAALAARSAVTDEQIAATGEQRAQKEREAAARKDFADRDLALTDQQATENQRALEEAGKLVSDNRARTQVLTAQLNAVPSPSLFQKGDTWHNALKAVFLGLGGLGDAMTKAAYLRVGKAAPDIHTVDDVINRDLELQKEHIAKLKDDVVMARTGLQDAQQAREQMIADVNLKGAVAHGRLEKLLAARLAAIGMSAPEIEQHQQILAQREKQADFRAKYVEPLVTSLTKKFEATKKTNEDVNRTGGAGAMKATEAAMEAVPLANAFKVVSSYQPGMLEGVTPRVAQDADAQNFEAAQARLRTAVVGELGSKRNITGEAAEKLYQEMYEVRPTDKPEVRAAKLQRLKSDLDAMTMGGVSAQLAAPAAAAPPPAAAPAPARPTQPPPFVPAPAPAAAPPVARPPVAPPAPAPPAMDRVALLKQLGAAYQEAVKRGDPRAPLIQAKIREVIRGG